MSTNHDANEARKRALDKHNKRRLIMRRRGMSPNVKLLLLAIADYARWGEGQCTASNETLAKDIGGVVPRMITQYLVTLEQDGSIVVARRGANKYTRRTITLGAQAYGFAPRAPVRCT
jgi:hypothetical protein